MRILVNDILPNMIIDEDLYDDKGGLILSKGLSVTDESALKNMLLRHGISKIKVLKLSDGVHVKEKKINTDIKLDDYDSNKKTEINEFIGNLNDCVENFENEIIATITGNCDKSKLDSILQETINSNLNNDTNIFQLLQKIKDSDDITFVHCSSVSLIAMTIGKWMKLSEQSLNNLALAALLFDVGKFMIPEEILKKTSNLTDEEHEILKTHVQESLKILEPYGLNNEIMEAIKYHHERCDGTGYPYGLVGDDIPVMSKILAIADVFVALTSKRPYRNKYTPFEAVKILEEDYMQQLDITILTEFIKRVSGNYVGNIVKLSNGVKGEVIFINATAPLRPIVKCLDTGNLIDLSAKVNSSIVIDEFI